MSLIVVSSRGVERVNLRSIILERQLLEWEMVIFIFLVIPPSLPCKIPREEEECSSST